MQINSLNLSMAKRVVKTATLKRNGRAYLTKRTLIRATNKATSKLAIDAMKLKGYIVKAEGKWIVRIDNTGKRTRLAPIHDLNSAEKVALH